MAKLILLYNNAADEGTLSGGLWSLPLTEMQDPRPTTRARSANLNTTSTLFKIQLTAPKTFRAIVFGPTNLSSGATYRIRCWSDAAHTALVYDTGAITLGSTPQHTLDMHWTDVFWWSGASPIEDPGGAAGGVWVVRVFPSDVTAQYWQFDINNTSNPDGFVSIGRLFMGMAYIPTYNFAPRNNQASFNPFTTIQQSASGTRFSNRRRAARTFSFSFPVLPKAEVLDDIYRISAISGLDKQVCVIPDPDDSTDQLSRRTILGNLSKMPAWALSNVDIGATGFDIIEAM
jgi:hypothetical protein